jgi:hypothetical protein
MEVMLRKLVNYSAILALSILLVSCGTDPVGTNPEPEDQEVSLKLKFKSHFNGESVNFNNNSFVTSSMDTITPTKFKFIFSDIKFEKMDGTFLTFPGTYGYVSFVENKTEVVLPELPEGSYKSLSFFLGLDSNENFGDPARWAPTHPLNVVNNGLHWGWAGGYIFMAHEGKFLNEGVEESYTFHIATMPNRNQINIVFPYAHTKGENDIIEIDADLSKYFDGVHAFSLKTDISASHSSAAHASYIDKLRANIRGMFSAKKI